MNQETNTKPAQVKKRRSITKTDVQQFLLRGRAFIALILVLVVFTLIVTRIFEYKQHCHHVEACGH